MLKKKIFGEIPILHLSSGNILLCAVFGIVGMAAVSPVLGSVFPNLFYYVLLCGSYIFSFAFSLWISLKSDIVRTIIDEIELVFYNINSKIKSNVTANGLTIGITVVSSSVCVFLFLSDFFSLNTWGINLDSLVWHKDRFITVLLAIALMSILYLCNRIMIQNKVSCVPVYNYWWILFDAFISLIGAYPILQSNTSSGYSIYHRAAYWYEIYNRYASVPYSSATSGIYGHYGLFYLPILKLLSRCNMDTITVAIALCGFLSVFIFSSSINRLTDSWIVRFTAPIAFLLPVFLCSDMNLYYQGYPHRVILSSIICLVFSLEKQKKKRWYRVVRYASVVFALLWSSDFGLIYLITMTLYDVIGMFFLSGTKERIIGIIKIGVITCIEVVCAICIVNVYNLAVGGEIIVLDFFYPYTTSYIGSIKRSLYDGSMFPFHFAYFWFIAFFLTFIAIRLGQSIKNHNQDALFSIPVAVYGLGVMVYYMNRPAYGNLLQIVPSFVYCLGYCIEWARQGQSNLNIAVFKKVSLLFLCDALVVLAFASLISVPNSLKAVYTHQTEENIFCDVAAALSSKVPADTYCIGVCSFETYSILGWEGIASYDNVHIHYSEKAQQNILNEIRERSSFVMMEYWFNGELNFPGLNDLLESSYDVKEEYSNSGITWKYYTVKED